MDPVLILVVVLALVVVGLLPGWGYNRTLGWGYGPSGLASLVLVVLVIFMLWGRV